LFKSWQGDAFGDIGQHCMYLRGYDAENDSLVGHNSLGQYEPLYQVDIKNDRKISFLFVEVLHCECLTGTTSDKEDYYFSRSNVSADGSYTYRKTSGLGSLHLNDGSEYKGALNKAGQPHGHGTMTFLQD